MFDSGLIYRGKFLVNWSTRLQSAISDLEVDHVEAPLEGAHGDLLVDMDRQRVAAVTVDDRGQTACRAKALRVAAAEAVARRCLDGGDFLCHCMCSDSEKRLRTEEKDRPTASRRRCGGRARRSTGRGGFGGWPRRAGWRR